MYSSNAGSSQHDPKALKINSRQSSLRKQTQYRSKIMKAESSNRTGNLFTQLLPETGIQGLDGGSEEGPRASNYSPTGPKTLSLQKGLKCRHRLSLRKAVRLVCEDLYLLLMKSKACLSMANEKATDVSEPNTQ